MESIKFARRPSYRMIVVLCKGIKGVWYWTWGHLFVFLFYNKKYIQGRWFEGRFSGICAEGWRWVVHDGLSRLFSLDNKDAKFPVNQKCRVINPQNIEFDPDDLNNFQSYGIYYQALGKICIGKGSFIGPNVGLITSNHDPSNLNMHLEPRPIKIGEKCWIGINSVILPGVTLGEHTVVGAGSVVTKSFEKGHCIIAGNPARVIRELDC